MTDTNLTSIHVVLDESGSMGPVAGDTIGGFNAFLARQKTEPGRATVSLTKFNTRAEVVYTAVPLAHVANLGPATYTPGGGTALLDAIAKTIHAARTRIEETCPTERPAKVVVLILTDGEENSSRELKKRDIAEMIRAHREEHGWQFVFMGANVDAFAEARSLGIEQGNALQYGSTPSGTRAVFDRMSDGTSGYRRQHASHVADYFAPSPPPKSTPPSRKS